MSASKPPKLSPENSERHRALIAWLRWKRATEYQPRIELWRQGLPWGLTDDAIRVRVGFDWGCKRPQSDVEG